eukprot:COSAG05_NODE_2680_length_2775_cov_5.741779_1_plen_158_part_00
MVTAANRFNIGGVNKTAHAANCVNQYCGGASPYCGGSSACESLASRCRDSCQYEFPTIVIGRSRVQFSKWQPLSGKANNSAFWCPPAACGSANLPDECKSHVCATEEQSVCGNAKNTSAGNCFICLGAHQSALIRAGCTNADFEKFCAQSNGSLSAQ